MSHYFQYYEEQVGGASDVRNMYADASYQRGRGVGGWLASPNVLDDVANNGANFAEAVQLRAKEPGKNLKRKAIDKLPDMMEGSDYKTHRWKHKRQSKGRSSQSIARQGRRVIKRKKSVRKSSSLSKKRKKSSKKNKTFSVRNLTDIFGPK